MLSPRLWPEAVVTLARTFGARGLVYRSRHELRRSMGRFRLEPRYRLSASAPAQPHPFIVDSDLLAAATDRGVALARADRILQGQYEAFRWHWRDFPRTPEDWLKLPEHSSATGLAMPWWRVRHLGHAGVDIKNLWEPGRFAWVYDLVRAYLITGDDRYAHGFHERFQSWLASSPPFRGPHWSCGQETSIRAVALLYAEANLQNAPSSTDKAMRAIADALAASGERIADAIEYAISQRNNHAISEAAGLVVLGMRFQHSHPEAEGWLRRGTRWLDRLIMEQFAEDGWYIQHSFTYLRVALDQCVLAQRVLRQVGHSLSERAIEALSAAAELLVAVMDHRTGLVPNHGANDGAMVHPITLAPYRDFRPVLTAVCAIFDAAFPECVEPDREVAAWLGFDPVRYRRCTGDGVVSGTSGWAVARVGGTSAFIRAGRYLSRPGHIDPLHLDVRLDGKEVVVDPGTFAYNAPAPWRNGLSGAKVHNGPILDGAQPGVQGPRFLWYVWPVAELVQVVWADGVARIVAEVPGRLRRVVTVSHKGVEVEDEVLAEASEVLIRWLLHPDADPRQVAVDGESQLRAAAEWEVNGWFSPHYGQRLPSRYVEIRRHVARGSRIVSRIQIVAQRPGSGSRATVIPLSDAI